MRRLYDASFSYRVFKEEVAFLRDAYKTHAAPAGSQLGSVLDMGCGPSRHLIGLARAGVPKLAGLDISHDMLAYARGLADKADVKPSQLDLVQGDMTNFDLPTKVGVGAR